jgi:hypothetical protein
MSLVDELLADLRDEENGEMATAAENYSFKEPGIPASLIKASKESVQPEIFSLRLTKLLKVCLDLISLAYKSLGYPRMLRNTGYFSRQ